MRMKVMLITDGTGMTGVVNKLQRILGLRVSENLKPFTSIPNEVKPIVFIFIWNIILIKHLG